MPRKTVTIYDGDDFERLSEARTAVAIAERALAEVRMRNVGASSGRFGDDEPDAIAEAEAEVQAAKVAHDALLDEVVERAEAWVLESIGHEAWHDLLLAHPPRKVTEVQGEAEAAKEVEVDHPEDAQFGVNVETFGKALLLFVDPDDDEHRTITEVSGVDLSKIASRVKRLSQGQFDTLWIWAHALNTGGANDPKESRLLPAPRSI